MTDADTPRVPDEPEFRWHPDHGMFREHCGYWHHVLNRQGWGPAATTPEELATMPADAVKLGDVEALRDEVEKRAELWKQQALDLNEATVKLAEIRAVLDDKWPSHMAFEDFMAEQLDRIRALLDREPGHEEPKQVPPLALMSSCGLPGHSTYCGCTGVVCYGSGPGECTSPDAHLDGCPNSPARTAAPREEDDK